MKYKSKQYNNIYINNNNLYLIIKINKIIFS